MVRARRALFLLGVAAAVPSEPHWFEDQRVDHFSTSGRAWRQRYYMSDAYFGGPGSPIFVILGGEGGIPPEVGIFYPWVSEVLAKTYKALVLEPEHRFYGESLPFGNASFAPERLAVMNSQQALADAAHFIRTQQQRWNCTARGTEGYCPVLTIGGSYPGFLSAMMRPRREDAPGGGFLWLKSVLPSRCPCVHLARLRYPAVVDMAYAASAPMRFYSQQVGQYEYYAKVTESAERSLAGCAQAVRLAFEELEEFFSQASVDDIAGRFPLCTPVAPGTSKEGLADDLLFLAQQTFANLNMANYPPDNQTGLHKTCVGFVAASAKGGSALVDAIKQLLLTQTRALRARFASGRSLLLHPLHVEEVPDQCFDLAAHLPGGPNATARCGDWSGCGSGRDGEMWDFQTCTMEVEHIGFGSPQQMFPARPWTSRWLAQHCGRRFGALPDPLGLTSLWGFDEANLRAQASRIVFTNGLNDGWSVGGILRDLAPEKGLLAINLPNGAHHSDLSHGFGTEDTPDVRAAHGRLLGLVGSWIAEVKREGRRVSHALEAELLI